MTRLLKIGGFLSLLLLAAIPMRAADIAYSVTNMGSFSPLAINNSGQVIGFTMPDTGGQQAVLYSNGKINSLGSLNEESSYATGINDQGQIVGYLYTQGGPHRAFLYSDGKMADLNTLIDPSLGLTLNDAAAINNHGLIVGTSSTAGESQHVFLYSNGAVNDLGILGTNNWIAGVNDSGQFIGTYANTEGYGFGITFIDGHFISIGDPQSTETSAVGINASGQIVGGTTNQTVYAHAYLYSNGTMTDIDPTGQHSYAFAINDLGQVVGNFANNHAFLYSDGIMHDLNGMIDPTLGITLFGGEGINNSGQIIALGSDSNQNNTAFLLTPVPEPAMITLLLICFSGIIAYSCYPILQRKTIS